MTAFAPGRETLADAASQFCEEITICGRSVQARVGRKVFSLSDGVAPVAVPVRRFLVRLADLEGFPSIADVLEWRGRRYRLGCPDGGPPWRWHGNDNSCIAIYAQETPA